MNKKEKIYLVGLILLFGYNLIITSCGGQDSNPVTPYPKEIKLVSFSNTGCKSSSSTRSIPDENGMQESVIIKYIEDGKLYVEHQNAKFNCGIRNLQGSVEVEYDHTIKLSYQYELSQSDEMDCICPFDMTYTIDGLIEGEDYSLTIMNSSGEQRIIQFTYSLQLDEKRELEHSGA